jgi:hypothetical protein
VQVLDRRRVRGRVAAELCEHGLDVALADAQMTKRREALAYAAAETAATRCPCGVPSARR